MKQYLCDKIEKLKKENFWYYINEIEPKLLQQLVNNKELNCKILKTQSKGSKIDAITNDEKATTLDLKMQYSYEKYKNIWISKEWLDSKLPDVFLFGIHTKKSTINNIEIDYIYYITRQIINELRTHPKAELKERKNDKEKLGWVIKKSIIDKEFVETNKIHIIKF